MVLTDIPSRCRVTYDRRFLPGETPMSVLNALPVKGTSALGQHATNTGGALRGAKFFPARVFPEAHPLAGCVAQTARSGIESQD